MPFARQPAACPADRRAGQRAGPARPRRAVLRARSHRDRHHGRVAREIVRGRNGAVLQPSARSRRGLVRGRCDHRPWPVVLAGELTELRAAVRNGSSTSATAAHTGLVALGRWSPSSRRTAMPGCGSTATPTWPPSWPSPDARRTSCRSPTSPRRCRSCSARRWRHERRTAELAGRAPRDARAEPLVGLSRRHLILMIVVVVGMIVLPSLLDSGGGTRDIGVTGAFPDELPGAIADQGDAVDCTVRVHRYDDVAAARKPSATATSTCWSSTRNGWSGGARPTSSYAPSSSAPSNWSPCRTGRRPPASAPTNCSPWSPRSRSRTRTRPRSPGAAPTTRPPRLS